MSLIKKRSFFFNDPVLAHFILSKTEKRLLYLDLELKCLTV